MEMCNHIISLDAFGEAWLDNEGPWKIWKYDYHHIDNMLINFIAASNRSECHAIVSVAGSQFLNTKVRKYGMQ